jgi:hypothetical protein
LPFNSWRWRQDVGFVPIVHHAKQLDIQECRHSGSPTVSGIIKYISPQLSQSDSPLPSFDQAKHASGA